MQIDIERSVLLKGLAYAQSAVEKRNTLPILANVLLDAENGSLQLIAGDLDLEVRINPEAVIVTPGALTVSAHLLYDIVRKLPDGETVRLRYGLDGERLQIMAGRSRFALPILPKNDFPLMQFSGDEQVLSLPSDTLKRLIDKTRFAMSNEEVRYYLNGIYLHRHVNDDGSACLRTVATDGHRLACCDAVLPDDCLNVPGIILPRKTVAELRKIFDEDDTVTMTITDTKIRFVCGTITLTSKLIDGNFPDYKRIIPTGNQRIVRAETAALLRAVERTATVSTDKAPGVRLTLGEGRIEIEAGSEAGQGTARDTVEAQCSAEATGVNFNIRCLTDVLAQISGKTVRLETGEGSIPALVRDEEDAGVLFLLMPML